MARVVLGSIATVALAACALELQGEGLASNDTPAPDASTISDATSLTDAPATDVVTLDVANEVSNTDADADAAAPQDSGTDVAIDVVDAGPLVQLRYNVNGAAYGDFVADPGANGICGPNYFSVANVFGTSADPLYTGEAFGDPLVCTVGAGALPSGNYDVSLYFAEIYYGTGCAGGGGNGSRVFDIQLEGNTVANDVDLHALAGGCSAASGNAAVPVVLTYRIAITDGTLNVRMPADNDNAKISALKLEGPF